MLLLRAVKSIFYDLGLKRKFGSWILKLQSAFFDFLLKKCFLTNLKTDENWLFLLIDCTNYKKNFLPIDCKTTNPELGISRKTDFMYSGVAKRGWFGYATLYTYASSWLLIRSFNFYSFYFSSTNLFRWNATEESLEVAALG